MISQASRDLYIFLRYRRLEFMTRVAKGQMMIEQMEDENEDIIPGELYKQNEKYRQWIDHYTLLLDQLCEVEDLIREVVKQIILEEKE